MRHMNELCVLWNKLADVPTEQGCLAEAFVHFEVGADIEDVWHWFESQNTAFLVAHAGG